MYVPSDSHLRAFVRDHYLEDPEFRLSTVRVVERKPNPYLAHTCSAECQLTPSWWSTPGICMRRDCEIEAHCHPGHRFEEIADVRYSPKWGALLAITTCGDIAVWAD